MGANISETSIKNTVTLFLMKRNTQKLIKSTHQTNGTYIYRINTKIKTHKTFKLKMFKRKKYSFFKKKVESARIQISSQKPREDKLNTCQKLFKYTLFSFLFILGPKCGLALEINENSIKFATNLA